MPGACGTIGLALTVLYVAYMAAMAHEMAYPRACKGHGCYQALLTDQHAHDSCMIAAVPRMIAACYR